MNDEDQLNEILENNPNKRLSSNSRNDCDPSPGKRQTTDRDSTNIEFRQWQIGKNDTFRPAGLTREKLPPGTYSFERDDYGLYLNRIKIITDSLIMLPDNSSEQVLSGMRTFWKMEDRYRNHGLLYKRGILLWGPPGSGKTATLTLLSKTLIENNGIVN
jgi:Cdc6-like AAA superfamily ATPase